MYYYQDLFMPIVIIIIIISAMLIKLVTTGCKLYSRIKHTVKIEQLQLISHILHENLRYSNRTVPTKSS